MPYANPDGFRKWYAKNGDSERARSKEWYEANRARARDNQARYRRDNPEKTREACALWVRKNPLKKILASVRSRAKRKGLAFDLTVEDISIPDLCPVLGIPILTKSGKCDQSPSVDRVDNKKGYIKGNIVVVSWRANRLKSDATIDELVRVSNFYYRLLSCE